MDHIGQGNLVFSKKDLVSPIAKGYLVIAIVLLIWSSFALSIRAIGTSTLAAADVAIIRFMIPMLILLPFVPSRLNIIKQVRMGDLLLVLLGGVPFFFLAASGAAIVPTASVGTLLAGTPPFFVSLILWSFCRQKISKQKALCLALVLTGVCTMLSSYLDSLTKDITMGIVFLICASFSWALYTIGLKRTNLDAISMTLVISIVSLFITVVLAVSGAVESHWGEFSLREAFPFIVIQGVMVGLFSTLGYSYAVSKLGSVQASTIGSLSPALTALLAIPVFNEALTLPIVIGIFLSIIGVVLSNRF